MDVFSLTLFGPFRAQYKNQLISNFRTKANQALLIYLATQPDQPHSREKLMTFLWPGMPSKSARSNLRQNLYLLRQEIPEVRSKKEKGMLPVELIIANRQEIQLNPDAAIETDVIRFEDLLDRTITHQHPDLIVCNDCRQNLEHAIDLYQGDFLVDFFLEDSNDFEEWAQSRREYYRHRVLDALAIVTTMAIRRREYPQAQKTAERQLEIDNLNESAYRQLMEVHALNGRREQALATYEKCRRILTEELGMAPTARTTELYEKILAGDLNFHAIGQQDVRGYDLKELIAEGGHGAVHRAIQPVIGREVAVKVIRRQHADDPDFIRRFEAEAQIVARLEHPFIVPLYDYWRDPTGAYLIMRYMRHGSLLTALKSGPWNTEQAANLLNQIAGALSAAHQKGIVHRDLKPGNILLDEAGNAYLTDFGIAKDLLSQEQITSENAVVGTLDYTSPEQILSGDVTPQSDIYSLGAVIYETLTGEKPFADDSIANLLHNQLNNPIPLVTASRADIPAEVDTVLQKATAKKAAERYATPQEMAEAFFAAVGGKVVERGYETADLLPEVAEIYNPYKGLRAFQEADADDFFGRDTLVQQLVDRLGESSSRFLAIVGPSGSGKSSAVKAGLIPALRSGALPGSENWFTAEMVPGSHPLEELELALWPVAVDPPPSLVEPIERDTRGLLRTLRRILPGEDGSQPQLLLIIDQFEELFTLVEDEERRAFFLDSLLAAIQAPRSPLSVVVTLRADFYDRPLLHQEWGQIIKDNTEIVLPLNHSELTWAVREPARRMGVRLEEELVATIVGDVADQLGALPLLQYALTELFEQRESNLITRNTYDAIGGVQGALGRRAEGLYEHLDDQGKEAARQLFLRLVTLGEGIEDTRRRVLRSEVTGLAGNGQVMEEVLDQFGTARLLTFDRDPTNRTPTVEVAHEALLREWPRLRRWLEHSRDDVRLQRLLAQAAEAWVSAETDEAYLLRGSRLDQFAGWSEETQLALTQDEKQFLAASLAASAARKEEEESRRQRELEAARQLAESEKARADEQAQAATGLRQRAVLLGGALVIAAVLALAAFFFAQQSNRNAAEAEDNAIAAQQNADAAATSEAQAILNLDIANTREAEAIAAEAAAVSAGEEAQAEAVARATAEAEAIEQRDIAQEEQELAVEQANLARSRELAIASINNLEVNPELSILLAIEALSVADTVEAQNALHAAVIGSRIRQRLSVSDNRISYTDINSDGSLVAISSSDGTTTVWNLNTSEMVYEVPVNLVGGWAIRSRFSQDGTRLATMDPGETLTMSYWEPSTGQLLGKTSLPVELNNVFNYAVHPDLTQITLGYEDGSVAIWDLESGQLLTEMAEHSGFAEPYYSPNGSLIATASGGDEQRILIWDVESMTLIRTLNIGQEPIKVVFSSDNRWLTHGEIGGNFHIWDLDAPGDGSGQTPYRTYAGHSNIVTTYIFSPDNSQIASASLDSTIKLWDINTGELLETMNQSAPLHTLAINPDGDMLLAGDGNGDVISWDLTPNGSSEKLAWAGHNTRIRAVALSPDGTKLASASNDGVRIWDMATGQELHHLNGHAGPVNDVAIHPNGLNLISAGNDGTVRVWDIETGQELLKIEAETDTSETVGFLSVAYSSDSQRLVTGGVDSTVRIWDAVTGEQLHMLEGHTGLVTKAIFTPDDGYIISGGQDTNIRVWDVESGQQLMTIPAVSVASGIGTERLQGMAISPDGRLLATTDPDTTVKLWSLDLEALEAEPIATTISHGVTARTVQFSPNGQTLATAAWRFPVHLWDISNLENMAENNALTEILSIGEGISAMTFNADGSEFITGSREGLLQHFLLNPEELMTLARSRLTRTFTAEECRQYRIEPCPTNP